MTRRADIVEAIRSSGVVAIIRMADASRVIRTAEALLEGGVSVLEVTMSVPGAIGLIAELASRTKGRLILGAGTVLGVRTCEEVLSAGASFVVSPVFVPEIIDTCHAQDAAALPGCFSPTEIYSAFRAGADVVKVFPATSLGPQFIRDVRAPLPEIPLLPTGGVSVENAGDWIRAGAVAVGAGSSLLDPAAIARSDFAAISARARELLLAVQHARTSPASAFKT